MISINQLKNGMAIKLDGELYTVLEFHPIKPGKGAAFVRTRLKNMRMKTVIDRTFKSSDKLEDVFIETKKIRYLYRSGEMYYFMDQETYEEMPFSKEDIVEAIDFLKDDMEITVSLCEGKVVDVAPPIFVELKVEYTEPGLKGDTARSGTKQARLETGMTIQVPLFVETGDIVKMDTRIRGYVSRM